MNRRVKKEVCRLGFKGSNKMPLACASIKLLYLMAQHNARKNSFNKRKSL